MPKESITVRLDGDLIDGLDTEADENGVSRSEYIRQILRERHESTELREQVGTLRDRLESREDRVERLEQQLTRRSQIEQKVDTLAKQQQVNNAPFFVRWARWFRERD